MRKVSHFREISRNCRELELQAKMHVIYAFGKGKCRLRDVRWARTAANANSPFECTFGSLEGLACLVSLGSMPWDETGIWCSRAFLMFSTLAIEFIDPKTACSTWWLWKGQKDPSSLIDWWHARQALPRSGLKNCLDLWGTIVKHSSQLLELPLSFMLHGISWLLSTECSQ